MAVVNLMEKLFAMIRGDVADLKVRMTAVETRLDRVDGRLDRVEGRLEGVQSQLDQFEETVANKFVALELLMASHFDQTRAMLQQLILLHRGTTKREEALSASIDDHESRIAAREADAPVGGRPPKH